MSDQTTENQDHDVEPQTDGVKRIREEREQLAAERALLQRENAFLRAGVDIESGVGRLLFKAYDGDLDPSAIKASFAEVAPGAAPPPPPSSEAQDRDAFTRDGTASAPIGEPTESDPVASGRKAFDERLRAGASREDASAEIITRMIDAGARGDSRAVFDRDRWLEQQGFRG